MIAFLPLFSAPDWLMRPLLGHPAPYWALRHACHARGVGRVVLASHRPDWLALFEGAFPQLELRLAGSEAEALAGLPEGPVLRVDPAAATCWPSLLEEAIAQATASPYDCWVAASPAAGPLWQPDGTPIGNAAWWGHGAFQVLAPQSRPPRPLSVPATAAPLQGEAQRHEATARLRDFLRQEASPIRLFLTDVDGVMTDAGMYYLEDGQDMKRFHVHDGMALQRLQASGVKTGIITSEQTGIVDRRAKRLRVDHLCQGKGFEGKLQAALGICAQEGIGLHETAYIGDDINCLELLLAVGVAACPANATRQVQEVPGIWRLQRKGGDGVVREFIERLFPHVI
jgi:YrbI family 3-deoxy-D-manno-octulosonate 8-phosphate phosphatase